MSESYFDFNRVAKVLEKTESMRKKLGSCADSLNDIMGDMIFLKIGESNYTKPLFKTNNKLIQNNFASCHDCLLRIYNEYQQCEQRVVSKASKKMTTNSNFSPSMVKKIKRIAKNENAKKNYGEKGFWEGVVDELKQNYKDAGGVYDWLEDFYEDLPVPETEKAIFKKIMDELHVSDYYDICKTFTKGDGNWGTAAAAYVSILSGYSAKNKVYDVLAKDSVKTLTKVGSKAAKVFWDKDSFYVKEKVEVRKQTFEYIKKGQFVEAALAFSLGNGAALSKAAGTVAYGMVNSAVDEIVPTDIVYAMFEDNTGIDVSEKIDDGFSKLGDSYSGFISEIPKSFSHYTEGLTKANRIAMKQIQYPLKDLARYIQKCAN